MADLFYKPKKILYRRETDAALAKAAARDHLGLEFTVVSEEEMFSDTDFSSRAHKAFPFVGLELQLPGEEDLDAPAKKIAGRGIARAQCFRTESAAASIEARGEDASVVEDDEVAGAQEFGEVAELAIMQTPDPPRRRTIGDAVHMQQTRGRAVR